MSHIFLSHDIHEETPLYGGAVGQIEIKQTRSIAAGDPAENLNLRFPNHTSTHIDFPKHFCADGANASDYSAGFWVFTKVGFLSCGMNEVSKNIEGLAQDIELLIVKTGFEKHRGEEEYWARQPIIEPDLADTLRSQFPKLRVFGFDLISLSSRLDRMKGREAHRRFLCKNNILILEDMHLTSLESAPKEVIIAPLFVRAADGVPCTVIAHV